MGKIQQSTVTSTVSSNIHPAPSNKRKANAQGTHKNQSKRLNTISAIRELDTSHSSFTSGTNFSLPAKTSAPLHTVIQNTPGPGSLQPNTRPKHFQNGANDLDIYRNGLPEQNALYPLSPIYLNNTPSTEGSVSVFNSTPTTIDPELALLKEFLFLDQDFNSFPLASPDIHRSGFPEQNALDPLSPIYLNNAPSTEGSISASNSTPITVDPELAFLTELLLSDQDFNSFPLTSPDIQHTSNINFQTSIEPNSSNSYIPEYASSISTEILSTPLSFIPSDINELPQTISSTTLFDSSHNQDFYASPPRRPSQNNVQPPIYIDDIEISVTPPIEKNTPIQLLHSESKTQKKQKKPLTVPSNLLNTSQEIQDGIENIFKKTENMGTPSFKREIEKFINGKWYKKFLYEKKNCTHNPQHHSQEFIYIIICMGNAIKNHENNKPEKNYIAPGILGGIFGFSKRNVKIWTEKYSMPQLKKLS